MATSLLLQGKEFAWEVNEDGEALVTLNGANGGYLTDYDSVSDTIAYVGKRLPGTASSAAAWQIKRLTFNSAGDVVTECADGDLLFDNVWDNRASLSYS